MRMELACNLLHRQYLSDFNDLGTILKPLKRAIEWYQDHKNPISIDDEEGCKLIPSSFDGFLIRRLLDSLNKFCFNTVHWPPTHFVPVGLSVVFAAVSQSESREH